MVRAWALEPKPQVHGGTLHFLAVGHTGRPPHLSVPVSSPREGEDRRLMQTHAWHHAWHMVSTRWVCKSKAGRGGAGAWSRGCGGVKRCQLPAIKSVSSEVWHTARWRQLQHCTVFLKALKSPRHEKKVCNYVCGQMLSALIIVLIMHCIEILNRAVRLKLMWWHMLVSCP